MKEIKRDINIPKTSFFIFGPRGTGKSTFVKKIIDKDSLFIDFLDPDTFRTYSAFPETLLKTVNAIKPNRVPVPANSKRQELISLEEELHIAECTNSRQMNWEPLFRSIKHCRPY